MDIMFGAMLPRLLPLFLAASTLLADAPARRIEADVNDVRGPMNRMYNLCVGAGRANEGLRADWQRQLRRAREECGFRYIRFHALFHDDMGVYREDKNGNPVYNWQYIDELFDFFQSIGMKPFLELGFMPEALASGRHTIFWYRANVTPPKDYAKWEAFIAAFTRHITERYGADEVASWYFEVWNEPNLTGFWMGSTGGKTEEEFAPIARAEYYKLYETTARAVKSVNPAYRVGGPATAGNGWIDETLAFCAEKKVPLDFISTHSYATMSGYLDESGNAGTVFAPDRNAITDGVLSVRDRIRKSSFPKAELHYTEWSASYTPSDPIHDSYHSAAFILDKIRNIGAEAESMSYWTFTDIFEEAGPRVTPFHGGFGMFNYQDLAKPAYFAYKYLNRLGDTELRTNDTSSYVTKNSDGIQTLFWDFTIDHPGPSIINQEFYIKDNPAKVLAPATVRLTSLAPGTYQLKARLVGYRQNDVQAAWRDMGSPKQLTKDQVALLRSASADKPALEETVTVGANGVFEKAFPFRQNDVWLVELTRVR